MSRMPKARATWSRLNPPASKADRARAMSTARGVAQELVAKGASAVVLAGSWSRGDARRGSDIDLWAIGSRRGHDLLWRAPFLVSVLRTTEAAERRKFRTPRAIGGFVPGWRHAILLVDPKKVARRLQAEARAFRWSTVASKCDAWVADEIVGWAEEAVKLVRALATGNDATAAVQRDQLADHLGFVVAIQRRMFWESENEFWERVGREVGGPWARAQRTALRLSDSSFQGSCRAALSLYASTSEMAWNLLDGDQRHIVANACRVGGVRLAPSSSHKSPAG